MHMASTRHAKAPRTGTAGTIRAMGIVTGYTRLLMGLACTLAMLALTGCAATRLQADVEAFSTLQQLPPQASDRSYRFERLPSQQAQGAQQDEIERQARVALQKVGLVLAGSPAQPDATAARYAVQVSLRQVDLPLPGYGPYGTDAFWGWGWYGPGLRGAWAAPFWSSGATETRSELTLLLRDLRAGQVVFEGRAVHSDLPVSRATLVPALLDAALRDFPHPPSGSRRITIDLPGAATAP